MDGSTAADLSHIGARLNRLPMTSKHRFILLAMGMAYFFELGDINAFSFASPDMMAMWHMDVSSIEVITAALFTGMFFGAAAGGWLSDRYGRKFVLIGMTLIYGFASLLTASAWNPTVAACGRFTTGVGIGAIAVVATVYIGETFPASVRGKYTGLAFTVGVIGIPITAGIARVVEPLAPWGWRLVFVWGAVGLIDALIIYHLPESARWLAMRGQAERADRAVSQLESIALANYGSLAEPTTSFEEEFQRVPYRELFRRSHRARMIFFLLLWVLQTCGLYGFTAWVPTLLIKQGVSLPHTLTYTALMTIASPLGALAATVLAERVERKWQLVVTAAALALLGLAYGATIAPVAVATIGFLVSFGQQYFAVILYAYTPEHFPTSVRSSSMGFNYGVGRLANVFGPFLVGGLYVAMGYLSVFIYIAICWCLVALIAGLRGPSRASLQFPSSRSLR